MIRFGVWFSRDSIFVGSSPGKWWGIHLDMPWSEDVREYGAPLAVYLHAYPWKGWRWISKNDGWTADAEERWTKGERVEIKFRCGVQGCDWEGKEVGGFLVTTRRLHHRGGIDRDLGSNHIMLCPEHIELADDVDVRLHVDAD